MTHLGFVEGERDSVEESGDLKPPEYSDESVALNFAERNADRLRFVSETSKWYNWDGARWAPDETLLVFDLSRRICRDHAAKCSDIRVGSALASAKTVYAVERLARSDRRLAANVGQWDANPWILNTPGGVVDLKLGTLRDCEPADYLTKITAVAPGGECPIWRSFIDRITGGDHDLAEFLARMVGYMLTGSTTEHALFFCHGTGGNGKSVFLNTVSNILGDYACTAPIETFTASSIERHPTELAGLQGARLVGATETEENRHWAEARIKTVTGGDKVPARFMRQDFFEYVPQFKLVILGNHKPGLRSIDEAIRRRFNLVPFTVTIPAAHRDPTLSERLKSEWPGILLWALKGCQEWQRIGLSPPAIVADATAAYLEAEDTLQIWVGECCKCDPNGWAKTSDLFGSWRTYAASAGENAGTRKRFSQQLEARGFVFCRRHVGRGYQGIDLIDSITGHER